MRQVWCTYVEFLWYETKDSHLSKKWLHFFLDPLGIANLHGVFEVADIPHVRFPRCAVFFNRHISFPLRSKVQKLYTHDGYQRGNY